MPHLAENFKGPKGEREEEKEEEVVVRCGNKRGRVEIIRLPKRRE